MPSAQQQTAAGDGGLGPPLPQATAAGPDAGPAAPGTDVPSAPAPGGSSSAPAGVTVPSATAALPTAASAERGPLKVGILYTNNDAAGGAGVNNGNTFTPQKAFEGLVAAWNKRGGLAGRRIVPTYFELRSSSPNLPADLQRACTTFTQDAKVAVVVSATGTFSDAFAKCMARTPVLAGDYALGDATSLAAAPAYFAPASLTTDRRAVNVLRHYVAKKDRIGVIVEACAYNQRTYSRTLVPEARRLGLTVVDHLETRCFQGINDLAGQASDMQGAVLRFAADHVDKVLFVSGGNEGNLVLLFLTAAEAQSFRPHYALTSAAAPVIQEANTPKQQLANAVGLGWLPSIDTSVATETPQTRQCAADIRSGAGVSAQSGTDRYFAASTCDLFTLYDGALRLTRGATGLEAVRTALHRLRVRGAAPLEGAIDLAVRQDGPARARTFAWNGACGCFRYTGASFGS